MLLCEGYKDVIAFHAAGIRHAAGLCGTALTEDHVRMIRRLTGHVTLALDPDPAGQAATLRSARLLLARGCEVASFPCPVAWTRTRCSPARGRGAAQARADRGGGLPEPPHPGGGGAKQARRRGIREVLGEIRLVGSPLAVYRRMKGALQGHGYPRRIA